MLIFCSLMMALAATFLVLVPLICMSDRSFQWTNPTIDAMQAQMLREIPAIYWHRRSCKIIAADIARIELRARALSVDLYGGDGHGN